MESLCLKISARNLCCLICVVYRPPSTTFENDSKLFEELTKICKAYKDVIIFGDFNFPDIDWSYPIYPDNINSTHLFLDTLYRNNLSQMVSECTRFRGNQIPSLLDLILTSDENLLTPPVYLPPFGASDHVTLSCSLQLTMCEEKSECKKKWHTIIDFEKLNSHLFNINWQDTLANLTPNEQWARYLDITRVALSECSRNILSCRVRDKPWLNNSILASLKFKKTLWRRFLRSRDAHDYEAHRSYSNRMISVMHNAKSQHENKLILSNNKRQFYKYIRNSLSSTVHIPRIKNDNDELTQSDSETANIFSDYFSTNYSEEPNGNTPDIITPANNNQLRSVAFNQDIVYKKLISLPNSSSTPEGLLSIILKRCAQPLSLPLSIIMENSLKSESLPEAWKTANVIAIYKKGDKFSRENYRQISLTPIEVKVMEIIISDSMIPFLLDNNVIPSQQHGFLPGRSTATNLLSCLNDWTLSFDKNEPVDVIYLDYSKAFDKVPLNRLVKKLKHCGISGSLLGWISDFLSNRKFRVKVGQILSELKTVLSGVPQGSVLGPLLYLIYTSDVPRMLTSKCSLYADDTKIYGNPLTQSTQLQLDLDIIVKWSDDWLIPLNINKCVVLHLGKMNPSLNYLIGSTPIATVTTYKDLGVYISSDLTWSHHISQCVSKANRSLFLIKKVFSKPDVSTCSCLYKTYIRPLLEYGSAVWTPKLVRDQNLIEGVQRAATRLPYGFVRPSYDERLRIFNLPPEVNRLKRGDLITTYRVLHDTYSVDLKHLFNRDTDVRLRGHSFKLCHERYHCTARENFLCNRVFDCWNALPDYVVCSTSINSFKNNVDSLLF